MKSFAAFTYVNPNEVRFVGISWEEGGFRVDDKGNPTSDGLGNTVASFTVAEIDERDADLLEIAYAGEDVIADGNSFAHWLVFECGLGDAVIAAVCGRLSISYSPDSVAECRRILALPTPNDRLIATLKSEIL